MPADARASEALPLGHVVADRYRVRALLGRGGMGSVYEVEHLPTGRLLALKLLLPGRERADDIVARFRREAVAQSLLDHPNIVEVLDLGATSDGTLYLVMERVDGVSIADVVAAGPLAARRALVLARQVLEALAHAHGRGMIHRDLKPQNIMVARVGAPGREHEQVKLLDFGLVKLVGEAALELGGDKLTQTGVVFGTPEYMSPEQALGRAVDERADLYALGIIVFEMLTGRRPFEGTDPMALLRMQVSSPPPTLAETAPGRPWCTPAMERLVERAMRKRATERFASATEMRGALDDAFVSLDDLGPGI